jgi:hypothetical protein
MKNELMASTILGIILISGCISPQSGAFGPLSGFLFKVDSNYYLVQGSDTVYGEQEIKRLTGLNDLYPPVIAPPTSKEDALNYATGRFNDDTNSAKDALEGFDLQACITECESPQNGEITHRAIDQTCEQYCDIDYRASLQSRYDEMLRAEVKDPVLGYDGNGAAVRWRIFIQVEEGIIRYYDVDASTGSGAGGGGGGGTYLNWASEESAAKEILEDYLASEGIVYVEMSQGRYIYYPKIVPK